MDAWELNVDAKSLQNDIDKKKAFRWIVAQTRSGVISRQEVASMIPVSLLNIEKSPCIRRGKSVPRPDKHLKIYVIRLHKI